MRWDCPSGRICNLPVAPAGIACTKCRRPRSAGRLSTDSIAFSEDADAWGPPGTRAPSLSTRKLAATRLPAPSSGRKPSGKPQRVPFEQMNSPVPGSPHSIALRCRWQAYGQSGLMAACFDYRTVLPVRPLVDFFAQGTEPGQGVHVRLPKKETRPGPTSATSEMDGREGPRMPHGSFRGRPHIGTCG